MSTLTLDQTTIEKLKLFQSNVQIRDAEGNVVGIFRPAPPIYREGEIPNFTEDELKRSEEGEKLTTDEVLNRLRNPM
jgi:hypothetical protein